MIAKGIKGSLVFVLCIVSLVCHSCSTGAEKPGAALQWVNLAHLNHLCQDVKIDGHDMAIVHIYSEYPDYDWLDASDEGIACVDDAARAAVVYLRYFEITGSQQSLSRARKLLEFCRFMQAEDGLFYNFIFSDFNINRDGRTSGKSLGWWTARAVWALGEGYRVFRDRDPAYASKLEGHLRRTFTHIDTLLRHYPEVRYVNGFAEPRWLLYNSAADATSELMLGLIAYAEASGDTVASDYLRLFGDGLLAMQIDCKDNDLQGIHLSWRNTWHAWGNSQVQALARAGRLLGEQRYIDSAKAAMAHFYPIWIRKGFAREMTFRRDGDYHIERVEQYDQIAYGLRPAIVGALATAAAAGDSGYTGVAADLATWFFGNNPAKAKMYDQNSGRCFDGILSESNINRNSGAESTIEALYAMLEVEANARTKQELRIRLQAFEYLHPIDDPEPIDSKSW